MVFGNILEAKKAKSGWRSLMQEHKDYFSFKKTVLWSNDLRIFKFKISDEILEQNTQAVKVCTGNQQKLYVTAKSQSVWSRCLFMYLHNFTGLCKNTSQLLCLRTGNAICKSKHFWKALHLRQPAWSRVKGLLKICSLGWCLSFGQINAITVYRFITILLYVQAAIKTYIESIHPQNGKHKNW